MANTQVILLERVENLGQMGDVVAVKPGFARNFLLPQRKAMRANKENVAYFESQKKQLEATNLKKREEAEKVAAKAKNLNVVIVRQAAEGGQLYGSVTTRDIADAMEKAGVTVDRAQVRINHSFKSIGLFPTDVFLHPEVKLVVTVNVARSEEEAKVQAKTGRAMIVDAAGNQPKEAAPAIDKSKLMEAGALTAEEAIAKEIAEREAAEDAVRAEKSAKRATRKASKKTDTAEEGSAEEASESSDEE